MQEAGALMSVVFSCDNEEDVLYIEDRLKEIWDIMESIREEQEKVGKKIEQLGSEEGIEVVKISDEDTAESKLKDLINGIGGINLN